MERLMNPADVVPAARPAPHAAGELELSRYEDGFSVIAFEDRYADDFKRLNLAWLTR